jgi:Fe-S-cluster-containing hydrogenase component 2
MLLRVAVERCNGCGNCEMACAFVHASDGTPGRSRVHVIREATPEARHGLPILCLQCGDAACVAACPAGALTRNEATDAIELHEERCIRCRSCVGACPFGNMAWEARHHAPAKCDLCGGDPWCAKFCPTGTLTFVSRNDGL